MQKSKCSSLNILVLIVLLWQLPTLAQPIDPSDFIRLDGTISCATQLDECRIVACVFNNATYSLVIINPNDLKSPFEVLKEDFLEPVRSLSVLKDTDADFIVGGDRTLSLWKKEIKEGQALWQEKSLLSGITSENNYIYVIQRPDSRVEAVTDNMFETWGFVKTWEPKLKNYSLEWSEEPSKWQRVVVQEATDLEKMGRIYPGPHRGINFFIMGIKGIEMIFLNIRKGKQDEVIIIPKLKSVHPLKNNKVGIVSGKPCNLNRLQVMTLKIENGTVVRDADYAPTGIGHQTPIESAFEPLHDVIVTTACDKELKIWGKKTEADINLEKVRRQYEFDWKHLATLKLPEGVEKNIINLFHAGNGNLLGFTDKELVLWDTSAVMPAPQIQQ